MFVGFLFGTGNVFPESKTQRPCERAQLSSLDHHEAAEKSSKDVMWFRAEGSLNHILPSCVVVPVLPCVTSFSSDNVFPKSSKRAQYERVQLSSLDHREGSEKSSKDTIWHLTTR